MPFQDTCGISPPFKGLCRSRGQVGYALLTRAPVAGSVLLRPDAPRLACVKPVASVHPEPGSNSTLYVFVSLLSSPRHFLRPTSPRHRQTGLDLPPLLNDNEIVAVTRRMRDLLCYKRLLMIIS